jgi:DNA adenine methylase
LGGGSKSRTRATRARAAHARGGDHGPAERSIPRNVSGSFLRWAGSKTQLLPRIATYWRDSYRRYIEPFCGSASLFFALRPDSAVISDSNGELIETLRQVQLSGDHVSECLSRHRKSEASYYALRRLNAASLSPTERAARFIYLNALCFNGLYRVNTDGKFNVPFGSGHRRVSFNPALIRQASYALRRAQIEHSDFEAIVDRAEEGDFIYLDPPYATGVRRTFVEYGPKVFSDKDLNRLIAALTRAHRRGAAFVLSYARVPEVREAARMWNVATLKARRNIAGFLDSRRSVSEVLISNVGVPA